MDHKLEAAALLISLENGFSTLDEAVLWADQKILDIHEPQSEFFDLSLAKNMNSAVSAVRVLAEGTQFKTALGVFLSQFYERDALTVDEAIVIARLIYLSIIDDEKIPPIFAPFISHWDRLELAIQDIYEDPIEVAKEVHSDIRKIVEEIGPPDFSGDDRPNNKKHLQSAANFEKDRRIQADIPSSRTQQKASNTRLGNFCLWASRLLRR